MVVKVEVVIELVGTAATMGRAVRCLGVLGRAALVALSREALSFLPYTELINKEAEVIGVSDHLASELPPCCFTRRPGSSPS